MNKLDIEDKSNFQFFIIFLASIFLTFIMANFVITKMLSKINILNDESNIILIQEKAKCVFYLLKITKLFKKKHYFLDRGKKNCFLYFIVDREWEEKNLKILNEKENDFEIENVIQNLDSKINLLKEDFENIKNQGKNLNKRICNIENVIDNLADKNNEEIFEEGDKMKKLDDKLNDVIKMNEKIFELLQKKNN